MKKLMLAIGILIIIPSIDRAQDTRIKVDSTKKAKSTYIKLKGESNPPVYIDGIQYNAAILGLLDPEKFESVSVLTGKEAEAAYEVPRVVIMTSKRNVDPNFDIKAGNASEEYGISDYKGPVMIRSQTYSNPGNIPVIVINGEIRTDVDLWSISPDTIQSISVLKDFKAMENYNTNAGVILITTKKKK